MRLDYFAGAIFTTQEVVLFCAVVFLVSSIVLGLAVFLVRKFFGRSQLRKRQPQSLAKRLANSLLIGAAIVLAFFVIPTRIKDAKWERKQASCAKQVGYASPADYGSNADNGEYQYAYKQCLDL